MIKPIAILLSFCLITAFSTKQKKVIFFGDSITQAGVNDIGYITKMQKIAKDEGFADKVELIGKGIGGNKVYDLYLRMYDDVLSHNPDIVYIYIGVNDVWHKQSHGTGTDANKFERFYQAIIDSMQARQIDLILVTPGVIGEKTDFSNSLDGDLNQYSKIIKSLAEKNNTGLIDLRGMMIDHNKTNNPENMEKGVLTRDRVHLNEKGNDFVANIFWKTLKDKL
ncbi:SGNH/GDSL hydrolase family protein [Portibacter lacus]|uniref:SGNH hydrolase-type esterase domain-containing protein n=1 Tax=Portibacter lacus TaxID=1099794 RepID=A0AA37SLD0_9BACT|nr:GDSL-type esterase/lipase family protein [Portibacter lacus]GLR16120.1 hypothetical protein GCM10007940_07350 [Portibacter lacus]